MLSRCSQREGSQNCLTVVAPEYNAYINHLKGMHEGTETPFFFFFLFPLSKCGRKKAELKKPCVCKLEHLLVSAKVQAVCCCFYRRPLVSLSKKLPCNTRCHCNKVKNFARKLAPRCAVMHQAGHLWGLCFHSSELAGQLLSHRGTAPLVCATQTIYTSSKLLRGGARDQGQTPEPEILLLMWNLFVRKA